MNPREFFSENYQSAREKFLAACETADARVESYRNSHPGAHNPPLHTDVCTLGVQDASAVLVIGSGTHGVE
ncbi:MAG: DUF2817 domain-containing protein, partial [bacterium]